MGRPANDRDVPAVAATLASAFFEDPLWGLWTFPDEATRARDLLPFMTLMAEMGLGEVATYMTDAAGSITIWTPPGRVYGAGFDDRVGALIRDLFGARASELEALFEQFDENVPDGDYYHLEWWATHRERAGEGLGARLIAEDLARVDAEGIPSYLESTNPVNIPRYEALGFRPIGAFAPPGGPTITTMWRDPR